MRKVFCTLVVFACLGCSDASERTAAREIIAQVEPTTEDGPPQTSFGFMEAMEQGPDLLGQNAPRARYAAMNVAPPQDPTSEVSAVATLASIQQQQIAYSYGYGFQIASDRIAELQKAHVAMCEAMAQRCRILRISEASGDSWDGFGEIQLQVAADNMVAFGGQLTDPAARLGGELVTSVREGEDLTESIIDTEARLQSRLLLRDKLTNILRNNRGSVDELVKAEKAVADVNAEIDATRGKLERYRNRIRFSDVKIEYEPYFGETQLGFGRPVMTAVRSIGTTLGTTIAVIIYGLTALIPIALLVLALRWVLHRFGLRIRFWRKRSTGE